MTIPTQKKSETNEIVDPVEEMLRKTGCIELHYQVQECIAETQDWRKCQDQVQKFRACMDIYQKKREADQKHRKIKNKQMAPLLGVLKYVIKGLPKEPYKMVFVVRTDITMGRGKTAAQCAHAAVECFSQCQKNKVDKELLTSWLLLGQPKIVLKISSGEELKTLAKAAQSAGLVTSSIRDAGRTQISPGTLTVLGIGPGPNSVIDKITSHLKLL